jgi:transposase
MVRMTEGQSHGKHRSRRRFSEEFKREAVELVRSSDKPVAEVADDLGISDTTLGNWKRQAEIDDGQREGTSSDERAYVRQLESELAEVKRERELLKRTVAFWVKEST